MVDGNPDDLMITTNNPEKVKTDDLSAINVEKYIKPGSRAVIFNYSDIHGIAEPRTPKSKVRQLKIAAKSPPRVPEFGVGVGARANSGHVGISRIAEWSQSGVGGGYGGLVNVVGSYEGPKAEGGKVREWDYNCSGLKLDYGSLTYESERIWCTDSGLGEKNEKRTAR